ncbi:MAG: hypothetical protein WCT07_00655 [Candidatus Paceibacterota bacterium]|jgi:hypothetical protein
MNWIGPTVLATLFLFIGLGLWFTRFRLSKQEKDFVSYVHEEAKNRNLTKEELPGFLFRNRDKLAIMYSIKKGPLVLNNVPRVLSTIESTYQLS